MSRNRFTLQNKGTFLFNEQLVCDAAFGDAFFGSLCHYHLPPKKSEIKQKQCELPEHAQNIYKNYAQGLLHHHTFLQLNDFLILFCLLAEKNYLI
jgi:hypothetical protein